MGGGGSQTQTSESEPWAGQQPYLRDLFRSAQNLYRQGPQEYFPGQTVAAFSPQTQQAFDLITNRALSGSPQQDAFGSYLSSQLGQENLDPNLMLNPATQAASGIGAGQNFMLQAGQTNPMVGGAAGALSGSTGYGGLGEARQYAGSPMPGALPASNEYVQNTLAQSPQFGDFASDIGGRIGDVGFGNVGSRDVTAGNVGSRDVTAGDVGARDVFASNVGSGNVFADQVSGRDVTSRDVLSRDVAAQQLGNQFGASQAAANQLAGTAGGEFLGSNPYLDQMFDTAAGRAGEAFEEQTMPAIAAQFGGAGRTGSGLHQQMGENAMRQFGRDLQGMAADIYSPAYESERGRQLQAASSLGGLDLQGQGLGLEQGQSNQQAALRAALANQASGLQAAGMNQDAALQADLANQSNALQAGLANQAANLQAGGMNQDAALKAALANQATGLQAAGMNQDAALQAALANQSTGLQAAGMNQDAALQAALANQATGLQAAGMNQDAALQAGLANQSTGLQAGLANQQADIQGLGLAGDLYGGEQQRRLGAAGLGGDLFSAANQADLARRSLGSDLYLGERGLGQSAANQLGQLGLGQGQLNLGAGSALGGLGMQGVDAMGDLYGNIAQNQFRAGSLMPSYNQMQYGDYDRLMGVGNRIEDQAQRYMDANRAQWMFNQQAPYDALNQYSNVIYGLPGGYGTSTQTTPTGSRLGGAIGGAMAGAPLGPWGIAGGALMGLLG